MNWNMFRVLLPIADHSYNEQNTVYIYRWMCRHLRGVYPTGGLDMTNSIQNFYVNAPITLPICVGLVQIRPTQLVKWGAILSDLTMKNQSYCLHIAYMRES
jgi:hypothetical protein